MEWPPPRLLAAVPVQAKPLGVGQVEVTLAVTDKPIVLGLGKMTLIRIMSSAFHGLTVFALLAIVCLTPIRAAAGSVPDETGLSLDGTWRIQPANGQEREIAVPSFWERSPGLANVHQVTYRREFEVPESFGGRRVLLRFDAVGDAAEVSVNGQHAGGHLGACLPFVE
ncbi:MAG: sugar-binding domain-containing protein [Limisphaerales bacterium]